jgi:hypothetical protein
MLQDILTYLVIATALFFAGKMIWSAIKRKSKDPCAGCSSACEGCAFRERVEAGKKKKKG